MGRRWKPASATGKGVLSPNVAVALPWAFLVLFPCAMRVQAQDAPKVDVRSYSLRVPATEKSARPESTLQAISAPVMTTIAPEPAKSQALSLSDRRSAVEQMLQSHEFSLGHRSQFREGVSTSAMDLESVKLRISRNKVLVRAEFLFN